MFSEIYIFNLKSINCILLFGARSLVVRDLRSEAKVPGSSPAAGYAQRWAPCNNHPANV